MDIILAIPHAISSLLHIVFANPMLDIVLSLGFFVAGRLSGGLGIFLRVALLLIRMAKHYYDTHPDAKRKKRSTKIDNIFAKLYKEEVVPQERKLLEGHETGAKG